MSDRKLRLENIKNENVCKISKKEFLKKFNLGETEVGINTFEQLVLLKTKFWASWKIVAIIVNFLATKLSVTRVGGGLETDF